MVFNLIFEMSVSVDFSGFERYWVRYDGFWSGWLESGDFVGFSRFLDECFLFLVYSFFSWCIDEPTTAGY